VRLRRAGVELGWGPPEVLPDAVAFIRLCHSRGASAVELARADPSLLTELQLGAFFHAYWRRAHLATRRLRSAADTAVGAPPRSRHRPRVRSRVLGRRSVCRLDRGMGTAHAQLVRRLLLPPHRRGRLARPGAPRPPLRRFDRHLRLLRLLRFRALAPDELLAFPHRPAAIIPPRLRARGRRRAPRRGRRLPPSHGPSTPGLRNTSAVGGSPGGPSVSASPDGTS
jgi:hypothetical protein